MKGSAFWALTYKNWILNVVSYGLLHLKLADIIAPNKYVKWNYIIGICSF